MTKRELIDMFKNKIFPKQAEDLLKMNYEGLGELDKREFLRDTSILIMLAEKGLKSEQEIVEPVLSKIRAEIMRLDDINPDYPMDRTIHISRNEVLQIIDKYKAESEG